MSRYYTTHLNDMGQFKSKNVTQAYDGSGAPDYNSMLACVLQALEEYTS